MKIKIVVWNSPTLSVFRWWVSQSPFFTTFKMNRKLRSSKLKMFALFYPVLHKEKQKKTKQEEQQSILERINTLNSLKVFRWFWHFVCVGMALNQTLTTGVHNLTHLAFSIPAVVNLFLNKQVNPGRKVGCLWTSILGI